MNLPETNPTNISTQFAITAQIIARAFLWVFLLSTDIVAPAIFSLAPQSVWVYVTMFWVALAIFAATFLLGRDSVVDDMREICLFDVFVASVGIILFLLGMSTAARVHALMNCVFLLKYGRLVWPCRSSDGKNLVAWPTFGVLGWFAKLRGKSTDSATAPSPLQAWYAYGYIVFCLAAGFAIEYFGIKITLVIFSIFPLIAIQLCYRRILDFLQSQFDQYSAAVADAAERKQQTIFALEQANASKQQVLDELANMNDALRDAAHDLQAPLRVIGLRATRLLHATIAQERQSATNLLQESIQFMGRAIYDTVHEAKIVTGIAQPSITAIELDEVLLDLLDELDNIAATYKMADMATFPLEETGLMVASDIRLLRRILYNLMHNAISHSSPGTSILLAVRARQAGVLLQVWDNGPGIAGMQGKDGAANFCALAEKLRGSVQAERTTGHGLGLNNVLQLTKVLGLTMTVRSRVGRGTVFSVLLPLAKPALIAASLQQVEQNCL